MFFEKQTCPLTPGRTSWTWDLERSISKPDKQPSSGCPGVAAKPELDLRTLSRWGVTRLGRKEEHDTGTLRPQKRTWGTSHDEEEWICGSMSLRSIVTYPWNTGCKTQSLSFWRRKKFYGLFYKKRIDLLFQFLSLLRTNHCGWNPTEVRLTRTKLDSVTSFYSLQERHIWQCLHTAR